MRYIAAAVAGCILSSPCLADNELSAVDAFVASANSIAKAATDAVERGRATQRLNRIRSSLTGALLEKKNEIVLSLDVIELICGARESHVEVAARRNYIQAVAGEIQKVGTPSKIENLSSAMQVLFSNQSLDVAAGISSREKLQASKAKVQARCARDFVDFDKSYYGRDLSQSAPAETSGALPFVSFSAIGALIDAIVAIITPIVVEGTKIVDEERRRTAVLKFLKDPDNLKKIEISGVELSRAVSAFTWDKRLSFAGSVNENAVLINTTSVDLSKNADCKKYIDAGYAVPAGGNRPSDQFVLCWRYAWGVIEPRASALLKAAEEYDLLADVGDTDNALQDFAAFSKNLSAVQAADEVTLQRLWGWTTRLIAYASKIETSLSEANREKVRKAIDALTKG